MKLHALIIVLFILLVGAACEPVPPGGGGSFVPPPSIDRSGQTDVAAELQSWVDSVPDGATISFPAGARYRMSEQLRLFGRNGLTFEGNGATLFSVGPGNIWRSNIEIKRGSDLAFRDLTLRGANPHAGPVREAYDREKSGQHGIKALSLDGLTIDNVTITDPYGDFVYLGQMAKERWTSDVVIRNSEFRRGGRQGIALLAARRVLIESNTIVGVPRSTFDFEPLGAMAGVDRVTIRDNTMIDVRLRFIAAVAWREVNNITVVGNHMVNRPLATEVSSMDGSTWYNWTFNNNTGDTTLLNTARAAMTFDHIDGLEIQGNTQRFQPDRGMFGAGIFETCNANVSANQFPGAVAQAQYDGTCSPGPVARLYLAYFERSPDQDGLSYWVGRQRSGSSLAAVSEHFARSAEFRSTYGSLDDRSFVERVYLNVLGRAGDAGGINYWTEQLSSGQRTRGKVMTGFSESAEFRKQTRGEVTEIEQRLAKSG